jgi:hypothetical protein
MCYPRSAISIAVLTALLLLASTAAPAGPPSARDTALFPTLCGPGRSSPGWTRLGAERPVLDRFGGPGYLAYTGFASASQCHLMAGMVCPVGQYSFMAECRPATSRDGGASWTTHDVPAFDIGEPELFFRRPFLVRSPANTRRLWYGVARHAWYATPPKGGLWRSDDGGQTWTGNLFAGQPGESALMGYLIPHPEDPDTVYIGRGYDYGNVAVSTDAGARFTILCGHDNTSKTGDERCSGGYLLGDFDTGRLISKVWWQQAYSMKLDGSDAREVTFPGVYAPDGSPHMYDNLDLAVRGRQRSSGESMGRYTARGGFLYVDALTGGVFYSREGTATIEASTPVNVTLQVPHFLLLAHPTVECTWVAQMSAEALASTADCGETWEPIAMDGVDFTGPGDVRIVTGNYLPDDSGRFLIFLGNGRRYIFAPPERPKPAGGE